MNEDVVSRQSVIDAVKKCKCMHIFELAEVIPAISLLPAIDTVTSCTNMADSQKAILQEAIDTYGKDNQLWMVIEEMSELAKEICKNIRRQDNEAQIADEIADVTIMLEQAKMIFGNADQVEKQIQYKVNRLKFRLSLEKGKTKRIVSDEGFVRYCEGDASVESPKKAALGGDTSDA